MRKGFIFDYNKCVNCNACNAACVLENGWKVHPRNIYTYNSISEIILPVINLSLACNHCESAICMKGCPTSALRRDEITGAIIVDEIKCIGCRYCQWNCPYDAPKFDTESKTIVKCNLCYSELISGGQPACSSSCPTGALSYGQLSGSGSSGSYNWFPDKKLNPAIEFTNGIIKSPLRIIPENVFAQIESKPEHLNKSIETEISLLLFSFLSTFSVATLISSFITGKFPEKMIFIPVLVLTGLISLFHLGRKSRSWRSVSSLRTSPLSREILFFITYAVLSTISIFVHIPVLSIISSFAGLIFLVMIDNVYIFSDKRKSVILHSGQTLISALLMASFFSGIILPFIFIALIKLISSIYRLEGMPGDYFFNLRFIRIAFLFVSAMSLISNNFHNDFSIIIIFMVGELIDRILFYIDYNPLNINILIREQINYDRDEKKRSK
jgi:Fe-S-cluster-containing dehydrogenase component/DMSO reductase anchor subunit